MKSTQILFRITDVALTVIGVVEAFIGLLGYAFFISNLPFVIVIPPFILLVIVLLPLKVLSSQRWLLVFLAIVYVAGYVFGGLDFVINYGRVMPELLDATIVVYFIIRAMSLKRDLK